ncbi:hypothetical protein NP233_g7410 [Leucocoprinus birnbaumii]|uniref:Uncharacterized protein n=1 Tax=Leucocoprinus birnbaumii TaxID=56174 RepID=A0AAD5VR95_9AGAR|nr:hypothetical protein NP233_g7410 [Leucocoprinus birnbaumii]
MDVLTPLIERNAVTCYPLSRTHGFLLVKPILGTNAMPLKGENPITTYFPRVSPDAKLKTPLQSKPRLAKRLQPHDDSIDSTTNGSARKKSKSQKQSDARDAGPSFSRTPRPSDVFSPSQKASREVIEIEETPPNTPVKRRLFCQFTSSPLPDLTPSPEPPPRPCAPSHTSHLEADADPSLSAGTNSPEPTEFRPDCIPSSQTQAMEDFTRTAEKLTVQIPVCSPSETPTVIPERAVPSQSSDYIPSSQPDTTLPSFFLIPDESIPSSQSQFIDLIPTSPITPDFDTVPSSQSQEIAFSQTRHRSIKSMSQTRTSVLDICIDELEAQPRLSSDISSDNQDSRSGIPPANDIEDAELSPVVLSSQTPPACESRPSSPGRDENLSSIPPSQDHWNDGSGSMESLPDAVKEFRGMFDEDFQNVTRDYGARLIFTDSSLTSSCNTHSDDEDEMPGRLQNKVALVTGAASGIGLESAILFAQEGANVVLVDINPAGVEKGASLITERFPNVKAIATKADVGKEADVKAAVDLAVKEFGRLDVMFNNAGIMHPEDDNALNTEERIWDLTMQINLKGVWWGCKYAILAMRQNPTDECKGLHTGGSIINTASFVALMGAATPQLAYTASKASAVPILGPLKTPLLMDFLNTDEKKERRLVHLPMGRFGEAIELAKAALFLASDDSSYVTGADFAVDGGLSKAYVTPLGEPSLPPPSSLI